MGEFNDPSAGKKQQEKNLSTIPSTMSVKLTEDNPNNTNNKVDFDNNNKLIPAEADEDKRSTNTKSKEGTGKETPRKDRTDDEEDKEVGKYDTFSLSIVV